MGKVKATLDTNILISSLGWEGNPHKIFNRILNGDIEMITSGPQFDELARVLEYQKFQFSEEQKDRFKSLILEIGTFVNLAEEIDIIKKDPDDNMILETALAGNADYIITGDPDLLELKEFKGIKIITARNFLNNINP